MHRSGLGHFGPSELELALELELEHEALVFSLTLDAIQRVRVKVNEAQQHRDIATHVPMHPVQAVVVGIQMLEC